MTRPMDRRQEIKLAENLKRIMVAKNFTVSSAAKQIGMNKSTLHNYCNGVVPRNLRKIKDLADLLDVSLTELIFGKNPDVASFSTDGSIEGRFEVIIRRVNEAGKDGKR